MIRYIITLLLVLVFSATGFGATYYVSSDGTGDGSAVETPMNLKTAFAACTGGAVYMLADGTYTLTTTSPQDFIIDTENGGTLKATFRATNPGQVTITSDGTKTGWTGSLYMLNSSNVVFEDIIFNCGAGISALHAVYLRSTTADMTGIVFNRCTFVASIANGSGVQAFRTTGTGNVSAELNYCTITASSTAYGVNGNYLGTFKIDHCTINHTGTGNNPININTGLDVAITNNTITSSAAQKIVQAIGTTGSGRIKVTGNTITGNNGVNAFGIYVYDFWTNVLVANNALVSHNNAAVMSGVGVGKDAATAGGAMGQVVVHDNTFEATGTTAVMGHGILIGSGADGADVYKNKALLVDEAASTANIGMVLKSERCTVHHNVVQGFRGLYLKGCGNNNIYNNTAISNGTYALSWITDTDQPKDNSLINNIFVGGTYTIYAETAGHFNNRLDYNCYVSGSTAFSAFDGSGAVKQTTLAGLKAYRAALTDSLWTDNDSHSIGIDPQFIDTTYFRLGLGSPCLNTGQPTVSGGVTSFGAWQPKIKKSWLGWEW